MSVKATPGYDEVAFGQWLAAVEGAQLTNSSSTLHCWIQKSVREPAANLIRNLGVGAPIDKILSSLKLAYGVVFSFDELMREFLNVFQLTTESVTDYVVRLENVFALLRDNYSKELSMVDKTQHLRERFYQGLRKEIHQRLTPSDEDRSVPYVAFIKRSRQLEEEYCPKPEVTVKGARDNPQMKNVLKTLKEIKNQIEQKEDPAPPSQKRWKGAYTCYFCGEPEHWRRTSPQRTQRKRKATPMPTRSLAPMDMEEDD